MGDAMDALRAASEAYRRAHPQRADELDAAMAAGVDLDAPTKWEQAQPQPEPEAQEELELSNPDADDIGKFGGPDRGAPDTQRQAAVAIYPASGTARRRVLDAIALSGDGGLTDEDMQDALNMNPSTQRPRRVELVEGGWVEDSGKRRSTASQRDAAVWVLTDRGRAEWRP